jgi:hypothetical protein
MENAVPQPNTNPLKKFFRQPKIYIKLPSSGNFYPPGAIQKTDNNEYPVYAMTAKDEIMMKTPDALLNGQSTVDILQSCVPNIKNGWQVPSIDVDALLIAIRLATYGENLEIDVRVPNTDIEKTYTADLRISLETLIEAVFDPVIEISSDMIIHIRPLNYLEFTKNAIKTMEEQKIFNIVNDDTMEDEEKLNRFNQSFKKLTDINIGMVSQCIVKISTPEGEVTDPAFIKEFIDNADREFFTKIVKHLETQRDRFALPPFKIQTTEEEQSEGAPAEFEVPITLDASNFFG